MLSRQCLRASARARVVLNTAFPASHPDAIGTLLVSLRSLAPPPSRVHRTRRAQYDPLIVSRHNRITSPHSPRWEVHHPDAGAERSSRVRCLAPLPLPELHQRPSLMPSSALSANQLQRVPRRCCCRENGLQSWTAAGPAPYARCYAPLAIANSAALAARSTRAPSLNQPRRGHRRNVLLRPRSPASSQPWHQLSDATLCARAPHLDLIVADVRLCVRRSSRRPRLQPHSLPLPRH